MEKGAEARSLGGRRNRRLVRSRTASASEDQGGDHPGVGAGDPFFKKSLGGLHIAERKQLVQDERQELPVQKAWAVMDLSRSTFYYRQQKSQAKQEEEQKIVARLEELASDFACYGIRRMTADLKDDGFNSTASGFTA